ncbi:hypothetical protein [Tenacibaculum soleae]|uniref:hypothetical protein n=1 Tax=Tenacibaculum soleae TaxID=447689 RepID=UPI0026E3A8B9|nr:hypothetical protein [Tenacibaculum soleae]MDO6814018.1 hypothetical protein [Tenacibaculum soleae]
MKADIINTNYIFNHKIVKIWRITLLTYGIILISITSIYELKKIYEYELTISIISSFFMVTGFIITILSSFIYSRVGEFTFRENKIDLTLKESDLCFDLTQIEKLTLEKEYGKFYFFKINKTEFVVELNKSQISELKMTLNNLGIEINSRYFLKKIFDWFKKKNTLHNTV